MPVITANSNARFEFDRPIENRPVVHERVVLAVFPARIDPGGQVGKQTLVNGATGEGFP